MSFQLVSDGAGERGLLTVALLATPASTASTLYGVADVFASVGRDWSFLTTGRPGAQKARALVVSAEGAPLTVANGVRITPDAALADLPRPDVICVPDLFLLPDTDTGALYPREAAWIRAAYEAGAIVTSACSGALLLAATGILDGQEATTHWGFCEALETRYPEVRVHAASALVASGEGQRIITSGGGTTWQDLALYLVARLFGEEEAMQLARLYLLDWHQHGQAPFASLARARQVEDGIISRCQEWIAENYAQPSPVAAMAALSGLKDRSFKRRFAKATGLSPLEYVHTLRLEEAKQMLETGDLPVEAVANEVGYEDASFFRRLFRRKVGLSPHDYRRRFRSFRRALREPGRLAASA